MIEIITIPTSSRGDRSYLATDGRSAVAVDPQRNVDRVLAVAAARGVTVTHVFETHIHNDYLSSGLALARATGAAYHVNAADAVAFDRLGVRDGDVVAAGTTGRPTCSARSTRPPSPRPSIGRPGGWPGRCPGLAGRPGRVPGLLRADGAGQRGRTGGR